jgi:hypothetical protein
MLVYVCMIIGISDLFKSFLSRSGTFSQPWILRFFICVMCLSFFLFFLDNDTKIVTVMLIMGPDSQSCCACDG